MSLLELILIFVLQFEGIFGEPTFYKIAGHDVILPCATASSSNTTCSSVSWLYSRDLSETFNEVVNGKVQQTSPRAARLSLDKRCSLVIYNITAEDAGLYICRHGTNSDHDSFVHLSVLTISPSPPDADPKRDGNITLECSLLRYSDLPPCEQNSIRWMDETGTVLLGEGVGYKLLGQKNCVSFLSVKHQSGHNRRYTCQFVKENNVEIEADYTPVFTRRIRDNQTEKSDSDFSTVSTGWSPLSYVMLTLQIAGLIVMIVITVLVIRYRGNTKPLDNDNSVDYDSEKVQYENVKAHPAATRLQ
ncbi:butyrophilin subfamily 3 member A1-like isoform X2 [Micropterus salmoides]|uniref:butyrophilin subfamily 3 member A1-like isoform X2 n=1 Tax=Micropterus salmoides TaxID=27706 RepID=UPI0018ED4EA6|nr:butyrophilin subfamily 3 member A1-like isoform X2 [Micropterus salmoides]